jgi:hypothetical protein
MLPGENSLVFLPHVESATAEEAPTGRATFGIYEGNPQQIYMREQY